MNIQLLATALGISSTKAIRKAEEFNRLIDVKCQSGLGRKADICRPAVCLELSCRLHKEPFPIDKSLALSGSSAEIYASSLTAVRNLLQIKEEITIQQLAVQFGCHHLQSGAESLLDEYQQKFLASQPSAILVDFSHPVYVAVAMSVQCANAKPPVIIDKARLIQVCGVSPSVFREKQLEMIKLCFPHLLEKHRQKKAGLGTPKGLEKPEITEGISSCADSAQLQSTMINGRKRIRLPQGMDKEKPDQKRRALQIPSSESFAQNGEKQDRMKQLFEQADKVAKAKPKQQSILHFAKKKHS